MAVRAFQIGSPRRRGEGLRVGTVRYLPRGVFKKDYARLDYFDVWFPLLAPSRKLLRWAKKQQEWGADMRRKFSVRYRQELLSDTDSKQALVLLAKLSELTNLGVGCYCEDEGRCHRSVLVKLIRKAAKGRLDS